MLVIPFLLMEVINRSHFNEPFPVVLFVVLWILSVVFVMIIVSLVQGIRKGNHRKITWMNISLVASLILVALALTQIISDQMPCFLGYQNCD